MTVAALVTSGATVTTVTVVTNINTILCVPPKASKPLMTVTAGYGVEEADDAHLDGVFAFSLYCNFYNMATVRKAIHL